MLLSKEESVEAVVGSRREVGCQWERPEDQCKEVGVQSSAEHTDVAVQVDLIGLSCRTQGSCDVPWHCFSVREDEPGGGTLWQHCSSHNNATMTYSPPALSSVLLSSSPTRTPQKDTQHSTPLSRSNPSEHTTPSIHQSELSLPSMPLCGVSPSAALNESPETMGLLAPLSSDEEEPSEEHHDQSFDEDRPPIKRGRGRRRRRLWRKDKNSKLQNSTNHVSQLSSDIETSTKKRNKRKIQTFETKTNDDQRPKRKTAGLPVRYLQDYDMVSHGLILTNQEKERTETEKCKTNMEDQEKTMRENGQKDKAERVLFLPYYKQSLKVEQLVDYQNLTKQQNDQEEGRQTNTPILMGPGFEHYNTSPPQKILEQKEDLNEDQEPRIVPLKLTKLKHIKGTEKSKDIASKKTDWQVFDNVTVKEEAMEEDVESDIKLKIKTIQREEGIDKTQSLQASDSSSGPAELKSKVIYANKRTTDLTKYKRILIKEDVKGSQIARKLEERRHADWLKTSNQIFKVTRIEDTFGKCRSLKNPIENVEDFNIVKLKVDDQLIQANEENGELMKQLHQNLKRRGRPRKNGEIKQDDSEVKEKLQPVLTEQQDRPRRSTVGPPVRYLLESEEEVGVERPTQLSPEGPKRRGRPRKIQIESTEVANTSDNLQWPPEDLTNKEVALGNAEVGLENANSLDLLMTGSCEDREGLLARQEGDCNVNTGNRMMTNVDGVVCKMFVQGQDGNWTEQEAQTLKLKDSTNEPVTSQDGNCGKIYSSLETVTIVNHEVETAKVDAEMGEEAASQGQPEILVFKVQDDVQWMDMEAADQMQNATEVSTVEDDNCEITYEYEDIENFHYVVQKEKEEYEGDSSIQWANQKADDKTQPINTKYIKQDSDDECERPNGEDRHSKKKRQSNFDMFLVHQDVDTGKTTFIPPCSVRLQRLIKPF